MTYVQINQTLSATPLLIASDGSPILRYSANDSDITGVNDFLHIQMPYTNSCTTQRASVCLFAYREN